MENVMDNSISEQICQRTYYGQLLKSLNFKNKPVYGYLPFNLTQQLCDQRQSKKYNIDHKINTVMSYFLQTKRYATYSIYRYRVINR